jgi:hypothetical protein
MMDAAQVKVRPDKTEPPGTVILRSPDRGVAELVVGGNGACRVVSLSRDQVALLAMQSVAALAEWPVAGG